MPAIRKFRITVRLKDAPLQFSVIGYLDVDITIPDDARDSNEVLLARDLIEYRQQAVEAFIYTEIHEIGKNSLNSADFTRN